MDPAGYDHPRARILTKGDTAGAEVPYLLGVDGKRLVAGLRAKGVPFVVSYDLKQHNVSPHAWHHAAATLDATTRKLTLYLDGVAVAEAVVPALSTGNTGPVGIGRSGPVSGNHWQGKIDDVRIWSVVRSPTQIQTSFRNQLPVAPPGLVGNWRFDEGIGTIASDSGGTPQNASLQGGATWSTETPHRILVASSPM
jgi:hypothetical protein